MKKSIFTLALAIIFGFTLVVQAETNKQEFIVVKDGEKTATFKVSGNCGMCKKRIEKAATIDGVKSAKWDTSTKTMTVQYEAEKVTEEAIYEAIAASGHDTETVKATDEAYGNLMGCCQYNRSK